MLGMPDRADDIITADWSVQLELHFETLQPERPEHPERKFSFVDLLNQPLGLPEIPTLDDETFDSCDSPLPDLAFTTSDLEMHSEAMLADVYEEASHLKPKKKKIDKEVIMQNSAPVSPNHKIGTITIEERKQKIRKYLEKRKRRKYCKRISYDCRKRVADNRLRIKGRFVTREQAIAILGTQHHAVQALLAKEKHEE